MLPRLAHREQRAKTTQTRREVLCGQGCWRTMGCSKRCPGQICRVSQQIGELHHQNWKRKLPRNNYALHTYSTGTSRIDTCMLKNTQASFAILYCAILDKNSHNIKIPPETDLGGKFPKEHPGSSSRALYCKIFAMAMVFLIVSFLPLDHVSSPPALVF